MESTEHTLLAEELRFYGLQPEDASLIRSKDGAAVARVRTGKGTAILKCFENEAFRREITNYGILKGCGIPTIRVLGKSSRSILLEDLASSDTWRLAEEEDLRSPSVIRAIAKWYKTLHAQGSGYVKKHGAGMYEEWDLITPENIRAIKEKYGLDGNRGLEEFTLRYGEIRESMDLAPRTITYNDFYYTNLAVRKDLTEAVMFDYNLLGKGICASDIRNVTCWFSDENRDLFLSEYGETDGRLMLLDDICSPVVSLCSAMKRDIFPSWAEGAIRDLVKLPPLIARLLG
ncbi:MAG: hypothetical protein J5859_00260 [Clostridia bacterium]|nr:hypothetical protein [Clostridia bacterium]